MKEGNRLLLRELVQLGHATPDEGSRNDGEGMET